MIINNELVDIRSIDAHPLNYNFKYSSAEDEKFYDVVNSILGFSDAKGLLIPELDLEKLKKQNEDIITKIGKSHLVVVTDNGNNYERLIHELDKTSMNPEKLFGMNSYLRGGSKEVVFGKLHSASRQLKPISNISSYVLLGFEDSNLESALLADKSLGVSVLDKKLYEKYTTGRV